MKSDAKKIGLRRQKQLLAEYDEYKKLEKEYKEKSKAIVAQFAGHMSKTETESFSIGSRVVNMKVNSHSLKADGAAVKVNDATQALIREIKEAGKDNLLEIKAHKTNIYQLAEKGDEFCIGLLKKHSLKAVENKGIEIK